MQSLLVVFSVLLTDRLVRVSLLTSSFPAHGLLYVIVCTDSLQKSIVDILEGVESVCVLGETFQLQRIDLRGMSKVEQGHLLELSGALIYEVYRYIGFTGSVYPLLEYEF